MATTLAQGAALTHQVLRAAYPLGACALVPQRAALDSLVGKGLATITGLSHFGVTYSLTPALTKKRGNQMNLTLTAEQLKELLQASYVDGYEDGVCMAQDPIAHVREALNRIGPTECGRDSFPTSVTADQHDALLTRVRNGGRV